MLVDYFITISHRASASERDFEQRDNRRCAKKYGGKYVDHQTAYLGRLAMHIIFDHRLHAKLHVIKKGDDEQNYQQQVAGSIQPSLERGQVHTAPGHR